MQTEHARVRLLAETQPLMYARHKMHRSGPEEVLDPVPGTRARARALTHLHTTITRTNQQHAHIQHARTHTHPPTHSSIHSPTHTYAHREDACPTCLNIAKRCPSHAVTIVNVPTALSNTAMFRYAPNSFKLHRLPVPRVGTVLGLIGTNGRYGGVVAEPIVNLRAFEYMSKSANLHTSPPVPGRCSRLVATCDHDFDTS